VIDCSYTEEWTVLRLADFIEQANTMQEAQKRYLDALAHHVVESDWDFRRLAEAMNRCTLRLDGVHHEH
jgi:hypothetical protein